jgi:Holliday junction resolvasome RuvABC endonuclease subunit
MKIMGADLSVTCTGLSFPGADTLAIRPRTKGHWRLKEIADHVLIGAQACRADLVVIEGLGGVYRGESARVIPMLHGAVMDRLMCHGIPYMHLMPKSLKLFATGNGNADKDEMRLSARRRLGRTYRTHDECDADWLRVAGRMVYGLGEITEYGHADWLRLTPEQVDALKHNKQGKEIIWPVIGPYVPWPTVALR